MRELSPWARKSQGRDAHRATYARYITSREWFQRRERWAEEELARTAGPVTCVGGCGRQWRLNQDDLHHCTYDRLGHEDHDDLWPMCRDCHTDLHQVLDSTKSWRKLDRASANRQAVMVLQRRHSPDQSSSPTSGLGGYV